jgi:hypothetical protein
LTPPFERGLTLTGVERFAVVPSPMFEPLVPLPTWPYWFHPGD